MAGRNASVGRSAGTRTRVVRSALPLFETTRVGRIVGWNDAAAELTGVAPSDAVGRGCWEVIRGRDAAGGLVCHRGCSIARLAGDGWPVRCSDLHVGMPSGVERLTISTIVVGVGDEAVVLHPLQTAPPESRRIEPSASAPDLTPRQRQILSLLADGIRAKEIAARLSLSPPTVRNHIHQLLRRLGVTSQLAAVAKARELGLFDSPSGGRPPRR